MTDKIDFSNLREHWDRSQIKHIIAPALTGVRWHSGIAEVFNALSRGELILVAEALCNDLVESNDIMLDKRGVAECAGMTVSWVDNSQCEKAQKLRAIGVRYGTAQTSPVRFQRSLVMAICRHDEVEFPPHF